MNYSLTLLPSLNSSNIFTSQLSSTKIILVRHGQSTYNQQGRYQGNSDESVLTETGKKAAYKTGLALRNFQFDAIYSSPLKRVRKTTQEIVKALDIFDNYLPPVTIDSRLQEVNMAGWQGLPYEYVKANFPKEYNCWKQTPHLFNFDNSETSFYPLQDLYQRAKFFLKEIINKHRGQTVLIVAHGGINRALISTAMGLSADKYHSLQQCNCGISYLEFSANTNLQPQLKWLNTTNHLEMKLPKLKEEKTGWQWLLLSNKFCQKYSKLAQILSIITPKSINLILTDNSNASKSLALNLINKNEKIIKLAISQNNFLESWQQTIVLRQRLTSSAKLKSLITGLIIVPENIIYQILQKTLGIKLNIDITNQLIVIHYPQANYQPILQGLLPLEQNSLTQLSYK